MTRERDLTIIPFQSENQAEVKSLIQAGLVEHWGWLDPSKNPDLDDIGQTYRNALFLVAWHGNRIVGTGALVPRSTATAEIVRMSVSAEMRRKGVGSEILQRLREHAIAAGYQRLVLETTETWSEVIEFYEWLGFKLTHHLGGDAYFALELS
jgi:GNAT superfamily N-acetyltransferase